MALIVSNLSFQYSRAHLVLKNLSFELEAGRILGVMGPSGAGKTTLLKIIAGITSEYKGSVVFNGVDLKTLSYWQRAKLRREKIGVFFSEVVPSPNFGVSTLAKALLNNRQATKLKNFLEQTGLSDLGKVSISDLSEGEKQRIWLSFVLARGPEVLVLDEPDANLDSFHKDVIHDLIVEEVEKNRSTAIIATHDVSFVQKFDVLHMRDQELMGYQT